MVSKNTSLFKEIDSLVELDSKNIMLFAKNYCGELNTNKLVNFCFFDLCTITNEMFSNKNVGKEVRGKQGVYVVKAVLNSPFPFGVNRHPNCPKEEEIKANGIIYVGKSEGSIYKRINNHYRGEKSSLKLNYNSDLKKASVFFAFVLKKEFIPYLEFIIPMVEIELHKNKIYLGNSRNRKGEKKS